jgi:hypothetical protein
MKQAHQKVAYGHAADGELLVLPSTNTVNRIEAANSTNTSKSRMGTGTPADGELFMFIELL